MPSPPCPVLGRPPAGGDTTPSPETHHQPRWLISPETVSSKCKVRVLEAEEIHQDVYQTKEKQDMEKRKDIQDTKLECVLRRTQLERTGLESLTVIDSAERVSLRANPRAAGRGAAPGRERSEHRESQGQVWEPERKTQQNARQVGKCGGGVML